MHGLRLIASLTLLLAMALVGNTPASAQLLGDDEPSLLGTGGHGEASDTNADADAPEPRDPTRVLVSASASGITDDGTFVIAVVLDHPEKLHTWPAKVQDVLPPALTELTASTRTSITPRGEGVVFGAIQWPEPHDATVPNLDFSDGAPPTIDVPTYSGRAIAYVPARLEEESVAAGVELTVFYQACDDAVCYAPETEVVSVSVTRGVSFASTGDYAGFDTDGWNTIGVATPEPDEPDAPALASAPPEASGSGVKFLGLVSLPAPDSPVYLLVLGALGAIGGLVLNLTPCVLPVIPLKVMTISQHASTPGKSLYLGLWMAAGVVAFWASLALPVLLLQGFSDPSRIFGIWWITGGIGVLIAVMAVGLMGAFNITLPQAVYKVNPKADSAWGSFLFGIMTAVLGLPCFGFVVGALLPASANTGPALVITVFTSIGIGMAAPYLVLAVRPGLLRSLPKAGPGSDLVKQVMGLLLLAAAAYFIGAGVLALLADHPFLGKVLHWWVAALFLVLAGLWLAIRTYQISRKPLPTGVFGAFALVLAAAGYWVANNQTDQAKVNYDSRLAAQRASITGDFITTGWNDFNEPVLERAMASGKVVVMDFTAEWCLNCKALKAAVLNVGRVKEALVADDTIPITVDLTAQSAPGWAYLRDELGQTGIPTLAIYGPGLSKPWISTAYTSDQVLAAIEMARGRAVSLAE